MNQVLTVKSKLRWLILAIAIAVILMAPFTLTAQSLCDQLVVDDANVLNNRTGEVETAATQLVNTGADVRVRIIQTYGSSGNLDRYESGLEQQCPSWTDSSGNRKNNLVVILVSIQDRQTGLYYGSQWESALGNNWTQIQTNTMNPRFAQGDYAGGIIAGLAEINTLITAQLNGQQGAPGPGGVSSGWIVLGVIIFILALIAGLFLFRSYRSNRERRLAARQKALLAKQGAASKVNSLVDAIQMLEIKVNTMAAKVSQEDSKPLLDGLSKAKRLVDQGAQNYSELSHSAGNPEDPKLSPAQLEVIAQEYQKVLITLREADDEIGKVEKSIDSLQQAVDGFGDKETAVNAAIEEALRKQADVQKLGFKISSSAGVLVQSRQLTDQALNLYRNKQFIPAMNNLLKADDLASQAAKSAEELPSRKQEAEAAIQALDGRIRQVKELIVNGRSIFDRLSETYAESSWESIQGNGTEAENRINWTQEALESARTAVSMEQQDWNKALDLVKQGNGWLDEAESFMHSISAMETSLETAQRDAPGEITAAQNDITQAWKYINAYDEDIRESLEDDLREAEKKLNASNEELHQNQPDFLKVVKQAKEANESADKILAQARTEHETAERLRTKAAGEMRDARSSVSIAREYIQDHRADAGDEARNLLVNAEAALHQAEGTTDINNQIALAEKAESTANQAYSSAKARVASAWERRQPVLPPIIILPGSGSRSGSSSWGSRRSSPWGSGGGMGGRGGGGGSTGWGAGRGGGGGGRGGGSTRW